MSSLRWQTIFLTFLSLALLPTVSSSQKVGEMPNNLELLEMFLESSVKELADEGFLHPGGKVGIEVISIDTDFASFQRIWLTEKLSSNHNIIVMTKDSSTANHSIKIRFRWINWQIDYIPLKHKFWRKGKYQRNLIADFFVEVEDQSDKKIIYSKRYEQDHRDLLNGAQLDHVKTKELSFTFGRLDTKKSNLRRLLEPAFLFAISGAVVYIFYAIRSD